MSITAIGIEHYGGPPALHAVDLPEPHAGPGEVRVHVHAAGVNPVDAMMRTGLLSGSYEGVQPPFVPGMEVAGTVDELGPDVDASLDLAIGAQVVGFVDFHGAHGGYSQVVVLPAASVTRAPHGASSAQSAAFLNNALTARNTLDVLGLPVGSTLLVTGAAGAVGGYVTELAARDGLRVVAVASPADEDTVRGFGAALFVARGEDLPARVRDLVPEGVDAVADAAVLGAGALPALRDGGQVGSLRGWAGPAPDRGIRVHELNVRTRAHDDRAIRGLRDLAEKGALTYRVADVLPARQAAAAHEALDHGGLRGRLVLDFTDY